MEKSMICKYQNGLFLIMTSPREDEETFSLILEEIMEMFPSEFSWSFF